MDAVSRAGVPGSAVLRVAAHLPGRLDVDLGLGPGVTAVVGPSGAGKSTLLAVIAGLARPHRARVELGGRVLQDTAAGRHLPPERRGLGLAFQEARLFPHLSVRGNLEFAARHGGRRGGPDVASCAAALGITALLDRPADALSGGEARRVALARALGAATELLLLDEPLGGLDEGTRSRILPWLQRMLHGRDVPTLLVTHRMSEAQLLARDVVVLEGGRVVDQGAPLDVLPRHASVSSLRDEEAENLLAGTVTDDGRAVRVGAATLGVAAHDLRPGSPVTVRLRAGDILVGRSRHTDLSARNMLDGRITALHPVSDGLLAYVDVGVLLIVSLTADAVTQLDLAVGRDVVLYIKTTAVTVATGS